MAKKNQPRDNERKRQAKIGKEKVREKARKGASKKKEEKIKRWCDEAELENEFTLLHEIYRVINVYFADFMGLLKDIEDCRSDKATYEIEELVFACIAMFMFKQESRNHFNQLIKKSIFKQNFKTLFGLRLPHMDTVDLIMRQLPPDILEEIKISLIKEMIKKKTLAKYRLFGEYYRIAVDATGVHSYGEQHCLNCLHRTSSKGNFRINAKAIEKLNNEGLPEKIISLLEKKEGLEIKSKIKFAEFLKELLEEEDFEKYQSYLIKHCGVTSWFHNVLEARLITPNGFSLSIGTEWIGNTDHEYTKQDCELKAFKRLSKKIKKMFPHLSICIVADGLYANQALFDCCESMGWPFIIAFKEGNLPSVWTKVNSLISSAGDNKENRTLEDGKIKEECIWINNISYHKHILNWVRCIEEKPSSSENKSVITHFVYISSFNMNENTFREVLESGRLRQKIENEGFNTQKNLGYKLQHKYSRVSQVASKNYFQSLQIAHIFMSMVELCRSLKEIRKKTTLKFLWDCLTGFLRYCLISEKLFDSIKGKRTHFQFE